MAKAILHVTVKLPWYWRGYIWSARAAHMLGIPVDPDAVAKAIMHRARFIVG